MFGKGLFTHEVTPIEPMLQRLWQTVYTGFPVPRIVAKILLHFEAIQVIKYYSHAWFSICVLLFQS